AQITRPFSAANAFCSMLMVGMLMDLPGGRDDVKSVLQILAWRLPFGILFAVAAWYLLPFDPLIRQAVALCCLAPTAVFATMFTDKVLGNARLAGFTLALTAVIGAVLMVVAHLLMGAL
ncbi:MAG: permease, partial [Bifidobacteriales bacterium]|nr:permease [Bifidobacteriales bacterium]